MKRTLLSGLLLILTFVVPGFAQQQSKSEFLPKIFAGWVKSSSQVSADPNAADPVNGSLLKEFGFTQLESATYTKEGRKLTVKAAQFADASGAYGSFLFYREPEVAPETIGDDAFSNGIPRGVFYRANILADVTLDRVTPMSAGELRELANDLPLPGGNARNLPSLPNYLPTQGLKGNKKYIVGPIGMAKIANPCPPISIDFDAGAELMSADYASEEGRGNAGADFLSDTGNCRRAAAKD